MVNILVQFRDEQTGCAVVIDDDGRVAYAYLLDNNGVVLADVWLYNRCAAPSEPEWNARPSGPMANPRDYVRTDLAIALPEGEADFTIDWQLQSSSDPKVIVYLRQDEWAIMEPGTKPGSCRLAKVDGPLARALR